ncbi:Glycosyltransferase, catalytic subunit of cellulose synthase and poly-beta-1,6-N-acetylglucosamine synthase [Bryocella elongata]|uniref:Glycosyltransferase, catalytic subunit of cellulose synthase and poly-beta-1,6-N-acetylglucosamine synthase n=1 Tax=Bryocella elongata TaxID=863522 RepID=A0A1H6AUY2_9BACT|nr:glycosyltransferase family 2 protein [Bryocella elongata]SEG52493.1 Glycosyltransferase, catalytic subunit of cellulose synthase and poly-beta-1,6-N-acetylglucosamine synthase [Bryocella elongata]
MSLTTSSTVVAATLSVVIIGRNEGARLERCLESIARMDREGLQVDVIYVDSDSKDNSVELARRHGARVVALHPIRPTAALGRNAGWHESQAEFVLFLDGDTILDPQFVQKALPEFAQPRIACVWGHRRERKPLRSIYSRVLDLDWIYAPGIVPFCGGDAIFRRSVLITARGYDETLIAGEEPELCQRLQILGHRILHIDTPMTEHDLAIDRFAQYWKRAERAGHAYAEVSTRLAGTKFPLWSEESRRNRLHALVLIAVPVIAISGSVLLRSAWPLLTLALLPMVFLRSAWKARWKKADPITLMLYGVHSHLQQIPIAVGQWRYRVGRRKGRTMKLVEYKRS